ncbi:hypothetical protein DFP72DRAFT_850597 [Ephemerocybe angulata]|uniref:Uncharacterized protein n=1 Tax=Ephemerocybe angulata TaxID=980116 RepID=A0A8H6HSB7_9AGAR|nr:hypothetical protein DFP72DRAFT_850597 [Tulosesus angulatus]
MSTTATTYNSCDDVNRTYHSLQRRQRSVLGWHLPPNDDGHPVAVPEHHIDIQKLQVSFNHVAYALHDVRSKAPPSSRRDAAKALRPEAQVCQKNRTSASIKTDVDLLVKPNELARLYERVQACQPKPAQSELHSDDDRDGSDNNSDDDDGAQGFLFHVAVATHGLPLEDEVLTSLKSDKSPRAQPLAPGVIEMRRRKEVQGNLDRAIDATFWAHRRKTATKELKLEHRSNVEPNGSIKQRTDEVEGGSSDLERVCFASDPFRRPHAHLLARPPSKPFPVKAHISRAAHHQRTRLARPRSDVGLTAMTGHLGWLGDELTMLADIPLPPINPCTRRAQWPGHCKHLHERDPTATKLETAGRLGTVTPKVYYNLPFDDYIGLRPLRRRRDVRGAACMDTGRDELSSVGVGRSGSSSDGQGEVRCVSTSLIPITTSRDSDHTKLVQRLFTPKPQSALNARGRRDRWVVVVCNGKQTMNNRHDASTTGAPCKGLAVAKPSHIATRVRPFSTM